MSGIKIDPDAWQQMKSMAEPEFLAELIDVFLNDAPMLIGQMRTALAEQDKETVRRAAHSLKSNSASFGASRLAELSRELEMAAKGGSLDGSSLMIDEIEGEFNQLAPVLLELKNE